MLVKMYACASQCVPGSLKEPGYEARLERDMHTRPITLSKVSTTVALSLGSQEGGGERESRA